MEERVIYAHPDSPTVKPSVINEFRTSSTISNSRSADMKILTSGLAWYGISLTVLVLTLVFVLAIILFAGGVYTSRSFFRWKRSGLLRGEGVEHVVFENDQQLEGLGRSLDEDSEGDVGVAGDGDENDGRKISTEEEEYEDESDNDSDSNTTDEDDIDNDNDNDKNDDTPTHYTSQASILDNSTSSTDGSSSVDDNTDTTDDKLVVVTKPLKVPSLPPLPEMNQSLSSGFHLREMKRNEDDDDDDDDDDDEEEEEKDEVELSKTIPQGNNELVKWLNLSSGAAEGTRK